MPRRRNPFNAGKTIFRPSSLYRRVIPNRRAIMKVVNNMKETKHKFFTSGAFDYIGNLSGTTISATNIQAGDAQTDRDGNKIKLWKVQGQYVIRVQNGVAAQPSAVRMMIVQARGAALTASDFPNYWEPADLEKMVVLKDKFFGIYPTNGTGTSTGYFSKSIRFNIKKFSPSILTYNGTTASAPADGAVYVYFIAESSSAELAGFTTTYFKEV